jgi:transposase InsO family protein
MGIRHGLPTEPPSGSTYISTITGWLYLTVVLDLADRKIIGWDLSITMKAKDTTVAALKIAVKNRPVVQPLIFYSDRGIQANPMSSHRQVCMPVMNSDRN